jgi:hypothetical protein
VAAPWVAGAVVLSAGTGVLAGAEPKVPFDIALAVGVAALVAWRPFVALLAFLGLTLRYPDQTLFTAYITFFGVGLAFLFLVRRLPAWKPAAALLLLLALGLPTLAIHPAWNDPHGAALTIPVLQVVGSSTLSPQVLLWLSVGALAAIFCLAAHAVDTIERLGSSRRRSWSPRCTRSATPSSSTWPAT